MIKKIISGYYSRMLLLCIAIVCTVTITLFILCNSLIEQRQRAEYLKSYDIELNNLASILSSKEDALANTLTPVFSSTSRYQTLCRLYKDRNLSVSSVSYSIIQMMREICQYDSHCRGILLRTGNGRLFQYSPVYDTLVSIPLTLTTGFTFTPYQLQVLSDAQLEALSPEYEKPSDHVYGLCSTLFDYQGTSMLPLGQLIVLYTTSEFANSVASAYLAEDALFTITDKDQNILYSSDGNYESLEHRILPNLSEGLTVSGSQNLDGTKHFYASVWNVEYDYQTSYQIPASGVAQSSSRFILAALASLICFASILLYVVTLQRSDRKIKTIQTGMGRVGQNNLDYRLPVPKSNDEFTQIILSFNRMCDELQQNVEKAYLYEISQKKAELYAMQTSINPHFLYNTLEQIRVQIMQRRYGDASQMILLLSKMYRNQTRRNLYVSIGEELNLCENLINLYMYRFGNFEYEFVIDHSIKIYGIPKNTLHPLIENYFTHGLVPERDDNLLTVSVHAVWEGEQEWLEFSIDDNGASISEEDLAVLEEKLSQPVLDRKEDNGFALSNVNARLKLVFGEASRIYPSRGTDGCGFRVRFRIPPVLPENLQ
ncbi:MAG: histidine kinase [Eubacteriales bacterium]|nr:histidine kinase [Eubacteriales bacterium]